MAESVKTPLMGEIRLEWWREGLAELAAGKPARAPVLEALREPAREGRLDLIALERLIEARTRDLDPEPFADEPALAGYLQDTAGGLMLTAARLLAPGTEPAIVQSAGRAWGWASWRRAAPAMVAAGRPWTPATWSALSPEEVSRHVAHRVAEALTAANTEMHRLPPPAFPALAYAGLARDYARGAEPGPLARRARLTWAVLRGRF